MEKLMNQADRGHDVHGICMTSAILLVQPLFFLQFTLPISKMWL